MTNKNKNIGKETKRSNGCPSKSSTPVMQDCSVTGAGESAGTDTNMLHRLGWDDDWDAIWKVEGKSVFFPARVVGVRKGSFVVSDGEAEHIVTPSGRLRNQTKELYPAIGDWVCIKDSRIAKVLPRRNMLSRSSAGARGASINAAREQTIAANLDAVGIVTGLDQDFNVRRIERYLTLVYNCGMNPVIVLTKADLHPAPEECVQEIEAVAYGVPIHLLSFAETSGLDELRQHVGVGKTLALVGSSGVGKSTLLNRLAGEDIQLTGKISDKLNKGKHTTTTRDLIVLPDGGMIIDNPGIREIAFWSNYEGIDTTFPDVEELAAGCRFSNCSHEREPGCLVRNALQSGELSHERFASYTKMKRELEFCSERQSKSSERVEKERWKWVSVKAKAIKKERKKR